MSKSGYSFTQRLLHRVALQQTIAEASFDIENLTNKKKSDSVAISPVFVSGLARSGTTILLRYLYQSGAFSCLTYRDMPFVLMPNLWKKIANQKPSTEYKERAHQDGIMVGFDSPEAFEEVFWRIFDGKNYIHKDKLLLHPVADDVLEKFKIYVQNILINSGRGERQRYLSKNNNNVLRFEAIQRIMPGAQMIVPFRHPLQQAISLLSQHQLFSAKQAADKFSLDYMNWLGHFEFGLNQKSFFLGDADSFNQIHQYDKTSINFWLANWKNYYSYVNTNCEAELLIFNYDDFCQQPHIVLSRLFQKLNVHVNDIQTEPFQLIAKTADGVDRDLLGECEAIYHHLDDQHRLWAVS